ncbi:MAG: hypothetical protein RXR41_03890 [Candidatus Marsarchaeota archaeon]
MRGERFSPAMPGRASAKSCTLTGGRASYAFCPTVLREGAQEISTSRPSPSASSTARGGRGAPLEGKWASRRRARGTARSTGVLKVNADRVVNENNEEWSSSFSP